MTREIAIRAAAVAALAVAPLVVAAPSAAQDRAVAHATFIDRDGERLGEAELTETPNGVIVTTDVGGLPEGVHGFHIHETGRCDPADGFRSAGGHYAPDGNAHGFLRAEGPHAGDMPNQTVQSDGRLETEVVNRRISLSPEAADTVFDSDGSAIVIHAGADDYRSQPSGDAGPRIACAVIEG